MIYVVHVRIECGQIDLHSRIHALAELAEVEIQPLLPKLHIGYFVAVKLGYYVLKFRVFYRFELIRKLLFSGKFFARFAFRFVRAGEFDKNSVGNFAYGVDIFVRHNKRLPNSAATRRGNVKLFDVFIADFVRFFAVFGFYEFGKVISFVCENFIEILIGFV